jgi:FtsP/CotA-like multicopper oxidase with cupredoxin domain
MAGFLLVSDADEDALGLPTGAHEIPLLIQDRRSDETGQITYELAMHEQMEGFLGDTPFGNGIRRPSLQVETAVYRLRVVNGTNSRILRLALSDGAPMTLIGSDGGLLPAPLAVRSVDLATGERADLLLDLSRRKVGDRLELRSLAFESSATMGPGRGPMGNGMGGGRGMGGPGGMAGMASPGLPQGAEQSLLELEIVRAVRSARWIPRPFPAIERLEPSRAARTRTFRFESAMMRHTINGRAFDMDRVDERVRFGDTEIWSFVNDGPFPHPVHAHAAQFQVVERTGGRGRILPWETGWKDTVLVEPGERVDVIAEFVHHRGLFLMHCHNLVHEDMGMMLNFEIA